jgi:hypothetical protein
LVTTESWQVLSCRGWPHGEGRAPPARRVMRRVGALNRSGYTNGKEVDQSVARKAQQEPEGEMEGTETAATEEAL